jgi:hypothetical protein
MGICRPAASESGDAPAGSKLSGRSGRGASQFFFGEILWTNTTAEVEKLASIKAHQWEGRLFVLCGFFENKCVAEMRGSLQALGCKTKVEESLTIPLYDVDDEEA